MQGKIIDFSIGFNKKQRITLELSGDFRETYEKLKACDVAVEIKKYREKRSLDANAYAWVLIDKLSEKLGIPKNEIYCNSIRNIGGVSEAVCVQDKAVQKLCEGWERKDKKGLGWQTETFPSKIEGCTNVILYYGSSTYDTKQMSDLINHLVQDAKSVGIETMSPDELIRLMGGKNETE